MKIKAYMTARGNLGLTLSDSTTNDSAIVQFIRQDLIIRVVKTTKSFAGKVLGYGNREIRVTGSCDDLLTSLFDLVTDADTATADAESFLYSNLVQWRWIWIKDTPLRGIVESTPDGVKFKVESGVEYLDIRFQLKSKVLIILKSSTSFLPTVGNRRVETVDYSKAKDLLAEMENAIHVNENFRWLQHVLKDEGWI